VGGESLGTYSIEVDSARRPCVEVCAMCGGVESPDSVVWFSDVQWLKGDESACDWDVEKRKPSNLLCGRAAILEQNTAAFG
jgi:hypothetical protein